MKLKKKAGRILSAVLALVLMVSGLMSVVPDKAEASGGVVSKKEAHTDSYGREPYFEVTNNHGTNFAFCVDFNAKAPDQGTAVGEPQLSSNDALRRVLYYGNGGPGDLGAYTWTYTAMAASSAVGNIPAGKGDHYAGIFDGLPVPPEEFKVYTVSTGIAGQQDLAYWRIEEQPKGAIELYKKSSNESISNNNSCYSLEGCVVAVYQHGTGTEVGRFTTDKNGYGGVISNLSAGQYDLRELKAPKGFVLNTEVATVTVVSGKTVTYMLYNQPANDPVNLMLVKRDSDGNETVTEIGQFAGVQYIFEYYDEQYTEAQLIGKSPTRRWVLETNEKGRINLATANKVSGDDFYKSPTGINTLPVGTLKIYETKAPVGYSIDPTVYVVNIEAEDFTGQLIKSYQTVTSSEQVYRGGVEIQKVDAETGSNPQGEASLVGAEFTIYNRNNYSVIVNSHEYAPNEAVLTLTTDVDGYAVSAVNALPYGDYEIAETKAPAGYIADGTPKDFSITADGEVVSFTGDDAFKDIVIKGSVELQKVDSETGGEAQGRATLEGAEYTVYNSDGEAVLTLVTDSDGYAASAEDALIYGNYTIKETKAPKGYNLDDTERSFSITANGQIVSFTGDKAFKDNIIRGDIKGIKIAEDMQRMGGIPFKITSVTTGESHIIMTDENGQFNTSSEWNLHSNNTNAGKTDTDGIWFGGIDTLDDTKGALPYDTYTIEELPCEANEYMVIIEPFDITVSKDMVTVDLGTITNDYKPLPAIHTAAKDNATGMQNSFAGGMVTIIDTVELDNLVPGWTYDLSGVLMDKDTGRPLMVNGEEVTASISFEADDYTAIVEMEYIFDASGMAGKATVVYEYLYRKDKLLAGHEDIEDEGQTVYFPEIHTTAKDKATGKGSAEASGTVTIIDTVKYEKLIPGKEYTITGVLMDKLSGEPYKVNGSKIISSTVFTPAAASGSVDVEFIFDASGLAGKTLVVFEELSIGGKTVAVHADLNDKDQSIGFKAVPVVPETGDSMGVVIWAVIMAAAVCGIMAVLLIRKKKLNRL